jgi:transposase-like protein
MTEREIWTYSDHAPICPYCGYTHEHDGGFFYDEGLTEYECESCGETFNMEVYVSFRWSCYRKEGAGK